MDLFQKFLCTQEQRVELASTAENDKNKWIAWATIRARAIQATEAHQNPVTALIRNRGNKLYKGLDNTAAPVLSFI